MGAPARRSVSAKSLSSAAQVSNWPGHRGQRLDRSLCFHRAVGDYQRDNQPDDQQHCRDGGNPQPARRSRAFRPRGSQPLWGHPTRRRLVLLPVPRQLSGRVRLVRGWRPLGRRIAVGGRVGRLVGVGRVDRAADFGDPAARPVQTLVEGDQTARSDVDRSFTRRIRSFYAGQSHISGNCRAEFRGNFGRFDLGKQTGLCPWTHDD